MRLILHIGTEKTGSTAIQSVLQNNEDSLLEQGYFYFNSQKLDLDLERLRADSRLLPCLSMDLDRPDEIFTFNLINTPEKRRNFRQQVEARIVEKLANIGGGIHTIIASSEHFHSRLNRVEEIERVRDLFSPFVDETRVVCYLRDQADTAVSLYSTAVKAGSALSLEEFLAFRCQSDSHYFNYSDFVGKWESVFGKDNICLRLFAPQEFVNNDLLEDFFAQIDPALAAKLDRTVQVKNESINHLAQVLSRAINKHFPAYIKDVGANAENMTLKALVLEGASGEGLDLNEATYREIRSRFAASNEALRGRYFPQRSELFPPRETFAENRMLSVEQEAMLDGLIKYFAERDSGGPSSDG